MSSRRRYVVTYDIADEVRLRRVHAAVVARGDQLQYSVYLCDLTFREKLDLQNDLREIIHHAQDRVAFIDLGVPNERGTDCFEFMGLHPRLRKDGDPTIV